MKQFFLKYSFYANFTTRGILKQIAQFDSSEYDLKDHTQPNTKKHLRKWKRFYLHNNETKIAEVFTKDHLYTMSEKHNLHEQA